MDRDALMRKVRACLALGRSANQHEAAAAMRQAQVLMERYNLSRDEVEAEPVECGETRFGSRAKEPPSYLVALAGLVANSFGCIPVRILGGVIDIQFFGRDPAPEIAAYSFTVLRRQLEAAKRLHIRRVRKPANRLARGHAFAEGWLISVKKLLPPGALSPADMALLEGKVKAQLSGLVGRSTGTSKAKGLSLNDRVAGMVAGKKAELHRGVAGAREAPLRRIGFGA